MSKLMYGIGFNSQTKYKASEKRVSTGAYRAWCDMMKRCYDSKYQESKPTYVGCTVHPDWHDFQNFAEWYTNHEYSNLNYQLDKDLLTPSNKVYSKETCCFVPRELNMLLVDCGNARGEHPQGVYFHKASGRYMAAMRAGGERKHLGCFDCSNEAHQAYKVAKEHHVKGMALEWRDRIADNVFQALMNWSLS